MRYALFIMTLIQISLGQTPYALPFTSSGNVLELTVANSSSIATSNVTVEARHIPSWLNISPASVSFALLKPGEEALTSFSFSIDKTAPVNSEHSLSFLITNSNNEQWTKEIRITVNPPESFELFQNYPNPFNPTTTISYQLSEQAGVSLKIYDLLGREAVTLIDEEQQAGFHQAFWDASRYSSGMYVYQLILTGPNGQRNVLRKTMLLVK